MLEQVRLIDVLNGTAVLPHCRRKSIQPYRASGKLFDDRPEQQPVDLIQSGAINGKIAKTVLEEMFLSGKEPADIVREKGLVQVSDESAISGFVDQVIAANPAQVQQYREGKAAVIQYLVGQVMKMLKEKLS